MKKIVLFASILLFAACKTAQVETLEGRRLTITELNGTQMGTFDGQVPGINFSNGRVNACVGCNQIFASYRMEGNKVVLSQSGATKMLCPDEAREDEFIRAFNDMISYKWSKGEVFFLDKDGKVLFKAR